jgi:hypothetical protein
MGLWYNESHYPSSLKLILSDRTPFSWRPLCVHTSKITTDPVHCCLWLWTRWASLYGCGEGHWRIEDYRR